MTTEEDFQAALDNEPDDWQTRLVFADWLQDRGDPRAEGYRALGSLQKRAYMCGVDDHLEDWKGAAWIGSPTVLESYPDAFKLPDDWFALVNIAPATSDYKPRFGYSEAEGVLVEVAVKAWKRRVVEDQVALAFAKLPDVRRTELLSTPVFTIKPTAKRQRRKRKK